MSMGPHVVQSGSSRYRIAGWRCIYRCDEGSASRADIRVSGASAIKATEFDTEEMKIRCSGLPEHMSM